MIKKITLIFLVWVVATISFFGLSLWLDKDKGVVIWIVISSICLLLILFSIISLFKPKRYPFQSKMMSFLLIILAVQMLCSITLTTAFNYVVEERLGKETYYSSIGIKEKIESYKQLLTAHPTIELKNNHSKKMGTITFNYNKYQDSMITINDALESLEENEKLYNKLFGKEKREPLTIVLIDDPSKLQNEIKASDEGYVAGYYIYEKKSIYVAVPKDEKEIKLFKGTIAHEYTHHLFATTLDNAGLSASDLPSWFNEGLAAYVERKDVGISEEDLKGTKNVNYSELESNKQWDSHLHSPYNPYIQSRVLVGQLIKEKGTLVIRKLIKNTQGTTFNKSFEETTGKTLSSYESEILKTLNDIPSLITYSRRQFYQDKNPDAALNTALKINDVVPNVYEVTGLIASIYLEKGDYEKSITYYKRNAVSSQNSSFYQQLAEAFLYKDLGKSIEASEISLKLADKNHVKFYQVYLDKLKKLKDSVENDNPFKGYMGFISDDDMLSNKQKVNLLDTLLERYSDVKEGRQNIITLKQSLE